MKAAKCSGIARSPIPKQREGSKRLKDEKRKKKIAIRCLETYLARKDSEALK